ncbi:MAG: LuxR C-terminal-related transcriptional regulator [Limnohabitans sp.]
MAVACDQPIGLVIADPHPVMLDGLLKDLQEWPEFQIHSCAKDGESALRAIHEHNPDYIVLDLPLAKRSGLALIQELQLQQFKTRPIVFTGSPIGDVMRAIDLGIRGLVSKNKPKHILARCIHAVHDGHAWLDRDLTEETMALLLQQQKKPLRPSHVLTPREVDVARMVTEGWPNKKIATKLSISEGTAKLHLHHIYQKLNCPGRMALMLYMQNNGMA